MSKDIGAARLRKYLSESNTSQGAFARAVGVSQGMVSHWLLGKKRITAERARDIERATAGVIQRSELRPDVFGDREAA